jgi:N12 class adenine-specific DNA methylase
MAQDNITNLYNALKDDYDLGSENDFRKSLENADNRHNLYEAIQNDYDLGSEDDFSNSLGYGNKQQPAESASANNSSKQASFTQQEYGNLSTVAQDVAKGVGVAPKFDTQGTAQKIKEQLGGTKEKTQFVPEASNVVMATPTADALKKYPFLKADEAVPFNRETGEPFYTWVDENGKPLSQRDIDIRTAKQEITGEREYMQKAPAAPELPDVNANAVKLDGSITDFVDNQMRAKYGDNYLNELFKTSDGREVSGTDYLTELSQGLYDGLVNDVNNARIQYIDADDEQKNQIVTALADKYKGLVSRDTIESNMTDEQLQAEAKDARRRKERQQLDEAYNNAYSQRAAVMGENMAKAQEDYNNASWLDKLFGGSPVQRAYWMNQNDNRIKIADTQINLVLDAKRVLDTGKAYDDGESWSGRFVRGMRDAMKDTGLYDGGIEEMNDLRNVKFALDAYESGNATNEQKDLLDTYALLQTITGENSDALGRMYSAGQTTVQAIPFMLQMYINPIGSLGQSTAKAATQFALKQFGRSMMSKYMKRLLATSFKAGGRITGDMLAASLPAMTFGAPAITSDMYSRLIGDVKGVTDDSGNIRYSSREGQEKSKAAALAKAIGSNYFEYQSEMVGEYFRPLTNILSAGIGKAAEKIGLGQINDLIANLSNKNFYRSFSDFAKRTQWQGTIGEYLEEVVNNAENALFIGDMDFSTGPNGVFNKDVNIDTFLGVAAMTGFMSSLKTADYIRTRGRIKDNLDNAYNNGLSLFGVDEWEKISNELDNIDENNAAKTVKKLVNSVDDNDMKQAIANYAAASAMNHGFNIGDLKNNIEEASDNIVNGKVPRSAILGFDSLSPDEQQNVHDDGMIHSAILYPIAENGGNAEQVFIVKGNVALNNDGSVDIKNSSDAIYYKGSDGQIHQVAPDKIQAADVPVSVEDYIAMKSETEETAALENEGTQTNTYSPGEVVNINVNGNNYEATVNSLDGNGNIMVYYQDENGIDRPATFTTEQLDAFNAPQSIEHPVEAQQPAQAVEPEQPVESNTEQVQPANAEETAQVQQEQPAQQSIPTDEEGNPLYYNAPIEATINDLYDGSLNDEEIQGFIDANIQDAQKKYDSIQKKAPKIGTNKAKYLEQKREWQTNVDEAKRILDYWQSVDNYRKEQTHTTDADIQSAQAELSGDNARAELDEYNDNGGVNNAVSVASDFIRGAKITPDSFKAETGYGTSEQQKFVGMIAKEENGGKTIDRLAEELVSYDNSELNGVTYRGDTSLAKDAILEALQAAGTRGELAQNNTAEREKYVEARMADLDAQYMEAYGMTYDEYLSYEEQIMPTIWRDYNNYDEIAFNNMYAEEIQQLLNTRENGNTTGEKQTDDRGNQVLPEQQSIEQPGSAASAEPGTEIQAGVQGNNENAAPQGEAQQAVEKPMTEPVGTNRFGNIYNWAKGQFQSAASFLKNLKSGYLRGVFYREGIGDIDMIWGNDKAGLQHIIKKHIEEADDFSSVEDAMKIINETINKGEISRQGTNISLDNNGYRVSIAQSDEGNWVLTAFDKTRSRREKQRNKGNVTLGDQNTSDMENGTLVSPQLASSESKDTQTSANEQTVGEKIAQEEAKVEQNPTEAQKEVGNYKKGHVTIDGYNITIEQPKGSVRRGTDANGKQWEQTMNNTYGYIRGTEGVDGDHIDIFLSDNPTEGNVYVVDQVNPDGSFDEHKVMYGFNSADEARNAYLSNYEEGWQGLGTITEVSKDEFKKWVESSHRKTKPFAEYKSVNAIVDTTPIIDNFGTDLINSNGDNVRIKAYDGATQRTTVVINDEENIIPAKEVVDKINSGEWFKKEGNQQQPAMRKVNVESLFDNLNKKGETKLSENLEPTTEKKPEYGSQNKIVSKERYEELKKRMIKKLGQLNFGMDPELLEIGIEMTAYHLEAGARKFADYAKAMVNDIGDAIRPYLKSLYNAARDYPDVVQAGLNVGMSTSEEVSKFDVTNFDKDIINPIETAQTVAKEQTIKKETEKIIKENEQKDEQTAANTEAIASKAETVASKAERNIEAATDERKVNSEINNIGKQLDEVNNQLALLGYYEADKVEKDYNEAYGYMRNAERKAKKDAKSLWQKLVKDLNIPNDVLSVVTSKGSKNKAVSSNIAPAGGDVTLTIPLDEDKALYVYIGLSPTFEKGEAKSLMEQGKGGSFEGDNLQVDRIMYRIQNNNGTGSDKYGSNFFEKPDVTYNELLNDIVRLVKRYTDIDVTPKENTEPDKKPAEKPKKAQKKSVSSQKIADLFDFSNEPINNTNNETVQELRQRTAGERTDGYTGDTSRPLGEGQRSETEQPAGERVDTRSITDVRNDGERGERLADVHEGEGRQIAKNRNNNHAERGTDYAPNTPKARYDANVEAVRLAKELTDSGQQATDEQKAVLRQFSGWGGLGTFFNNERTRNELVELLGDDGYQQAAMSINSAYYTPADVIDTMWDIVKNLGFKGGNILEGSAGIGNILGLMPMGISDRSNIEAVEIDGVSGMILKLLYPDAKVDIQGFENTQVRNGSVDLAITNVPFVTGLHVHDTTGDRDLSRRFGNIHDFCIAKNVRKLREGGIGVFISSRGTLDKSKALRDWVVNEGNADFIGAFRLNNKTFGGTTATSDIIVVRKRVNGNKSAGSINLLDTESVRTVSVPINDNGREKIKPVVLQYNKYFVEHPENMGGEMALNYERGETFRPEGSGLFPTTGINQEERMQQWAETFKDKAVDVPQPQTEEPADTQTDTNGNEIKDGTIVVGEDGSINVMYLGRQEPLGVNDKKVKGHTKAECVEDYNRIKRALNAVLEYETTNEKDDGLKPLLKELNDAYDSFKDKYGNLNKNTAISFLRNDIDFPSIQALEKFNETNDKDGKRIVQTEKTSIFTERVVQKEVEPHPTNVLDAVKTSVFRSGRIDLDYISNALGRDVSDIEKEIIDNGLGYRDPATGNMEVSYEYLSGNVRQKLAIAEANNEDGRYDKNIKALRKVMPMDIPAHLIEFTFGSSWVNPKLFSDYVNEKTGVPVTLTNVGGQWNMDLPYYTATEKNKSEGVRSEKLNKIVLGTDLMNAAINNRTITVSTTQRTWDGKTETITDKEATQACAAKIDDIRNDFKDWARAKMQSDPELANEIERVYNDRFNNYVPVQVPDEFTSGHFPGASTKITLFPHQSKAVIRATGQPIMLAHEVGTGKTFTLITTAMEMRRLGLARKPMIVVQNATVGQFVASAKELYPNAKVLTIADNERNEEGRKRFYAKIKYNDWDMIVVPQSVFERIPDSEERQMDFINDRIEEKQHVLEQMQEIDPKSMIARNAKRELDSLQTELAEVSDKKRQKDEKRAAKTRQNAAAKAQEQLDRATDDVENFDDMEIDAVLVDEAHEYKHLGFSTAMQRGVKGVDPSYSKKSAGVYLKTRAVMDKSGGKNVVFATGTPISNTAAEIWTFMRYLMPKHTMEEYGIYYFDDFVRNFGNLTQMLEFTTSGKFRENNRFSGYVNIPELIRIWSSVSDTVLTKETNLKDKLPETVDGGQKATDIYLPQSASLRSIMKAVRSELERFDKMSGKEKRENSAIPLVMYGIAKAAAIDPRLVMADAVDEPVSKTNRAVEETLKSLEATKDYKGTVAIFCDTYQNKETGFNIYEEIKRKLVERGVPENQIVIMRSGMSVNKKAEIFDKVNAGDVRVIMGSTFTLGTGVNIQERLNTLIHLDAPNRPMDYTQRNGRILRQGNLHKQWGLPVKILRFGVEDSLDITAYQRLKTKGAIADSVMEGKKFINNNQQDRTLEEQEDVFGDTVAQLSGSEYALLKNQAERDFRKYNNKKKQYETDQIYVHNAIPRYEGQIKRSEDTIKQQQKALTAVEKAFPDGTVQEITIGNSKLSSQKAIGDYIKDVVNKKQTETEDKVRKGAQGTKASSSFTLKAGPFTFTVNTEYNKDTEFQNGSLFPVVHRNMTYSCEELGLSNVPVQRASFKNAVDDIRNNVLSGNDMRERIETENGLIERNRSELDQLKSREGKPFENEKELEDARKKVEDYTEKMRKEMEAKEQKYAEMDAQTQSADLGSLSGAEEAEEEELQRSGDGALTDDELSLANDPAAALTGRSTRTSAQRRRFAERERQRMVDAVQKLARKLNLDNVDIVTDASTLQGRRSRAKGFYSRSTGRITIVIPNHMDIRDVEQTLLHEAVAHYGLRQLFGEHFDTFLDNVYNNVDEDLKKRIDEIAEKRGLTTRVATEEYLATLAENSNFEDINASWWDKIKNLFLKMLHKIGFENFSGVTLSDNELRYILWRSYENLKEPGHYRSIIGEVRDMSKQRDLNVGNYAVQNSSEKVADNDDIRYRESENAEESLNKSWQDEYDERTLSTAFKFTEAAQDGMKSVSILQDVISKETGSPITEDENVWALQNRLSSTNKFYQDYYYQNYYKPLMQSVADLVKQGAKYDDLGRDIDKAEDDILKYVISKHGLERNEHFREQKARDARVPYQQKIDAVLEQADKGEINQEEADDQIKKLTKQADKAESRAREKYSKTDFSGLSELYKTGTYFEALAENYVQGFESKFDTSDLWNKINAATKATLKLTYESGLMSRAAYETTRDMYQNYIPLRGWSNDVASDMYNYKGETGVGGGIVKRAKGRKSLAENPLAVIGRMGQDGILQANKNRVKQRLYNLAVGHDTSLLTVSKQWYVNEGTDENPEWERAYPELGANMNADEVADALEEFDERMKELKEQGRATQKREGLNMKYHTSKPQEQQHRVNVSIGGREYNIYVNGNPRAAQAINGELRMDEDSKSIVQAINRFLANVYTSLNPEFIVTNYERDAGFAGAIVAATEDSRYVASWTKNMAIFNPLTSGVYINNLINKATKGTVDLSNKNERYMQEFLANGGETGFTNMLTADDYKKIIKKEIKEINKPIKARQAANAFMEWAKRANRVCEDATRFATYVTSREQGRSIDRAIRDAKEISLNFNTRGADGMANDGIIHKLFRNLRRWIIFANPSIQGLNKAGVAFKNHPVRSTIVIAGLPTVLGYMVPALAAAILGDDDDKEAKENYMDLPKWVRRTNICLPMGGTKFITIPLSYELRVSYGLGEMLWEIEQGQAESGELVGETLTQLSDLLPISFASGTPVQNLSPTTVRPIIDLIQNKDFTGRPIYKENTYNQGMPEFTKVYAGTSKWLVKSAEVLNNAIPQFWNKDYAKPDKYTPGAININPAKVEYLLSSYFGGLYTFPTKVYKTASMLWNEDMRDIRNIPFINRNLKDSQSGNPVSKSAGDRYNTYMKEYNLSKKRWNGYKREVSHGVTEFLPSLTDFTKSAPGQRMFIIDSYKKSTDELNRQIKYMKEYGYGTEQDRKDLQQLSDSLKKELVEKLDSIKPIDE